MIQNRLLVYNASAGSGKTFQIALRYLNELIQTQSKQAIYRLIGITFTNKAAEEMKRRIIDNLIQAAKGEISDVMVEVSKASEQRIKKQTGITKDVDYQQEIIKRSRERLIEILHYYDEFQLTTIDKLMFKIIKTFARDMHLSADVSVEMEYKEVVQNLIDHLINRAESGSLLSKFLIDFALANIEDEKSWDIKKDLAKINDIIFDDQHFEELKTLENKTLQDFVALKKYLNTEIKTIEQNFKTLGQNLKQAFSGFEPHVNISVLAHRLQFEYLNISIGQKIRKQVESDTYVYYIKSHLKDLSPSEQESLKGPVNEAIHPIMLKAVSYIDKNFERYRLLKALLQEVNALSIENELQKDIRAFKEDNNSIFISDFNRLILEQILKNLASDTPYIYMRLGEKYAHYFLDEFQDTSALQWHNLIPLIKEALSKSFGPDELGDALIVGDAKQSIYRFRGGKPEQFIALSMPENQSGAGNPFAPLVNKRVEQLAYNWRSDAYIVKFNNAFFSTFTSYLEAPYKQVYENPTQKTPEHKNPDAGLVSIRFLDRKSKDTEKESFAEAVFNTILEAEKNGFNREEICILVNQKSDGMQIASHLTQHNIDVVSSETLLVAQAGKVQFLLAWLNFLQTGNAADLYEAVKYLSDQLPSAKSHLYEQILYPKDLDRKTRTQRFTELGYHVDYKQFEKLNLYDTLVYLIDTFKLLGDRLEQAYLQAFLEKAHLYSTKELSSIKGFLKEWDVIKEKFSISAPDQKGAVQIMTVHKSKGLEFPVVIYYTDTAILTSQDKKNKVWIPVDPKMYKSFKMLPVKMGALETSDDENYRKIYEKAAAEKTFDNLNRLYVALTRASEQLYVILYQPASKAKNLGVNQVFKTHLSQKYPEFNGHFFMYGNPKRESYQVTQKKTTSFGKKLYYKPWQQKNNDFLKINTTTFERWSEDKKQAITYGMQLHDILGRITTQQQWQLQKDKWLSPFTEQERGTLEILIEKIIFHPELKVYFTDAFQILNERSILIPQKNKLFIQKRPDRLLINKGIVTILDYKTGQKQAKHQKQLQEYAAYLQQAGYKVDQKILVYIQDNILIEVVP